MSVPDVPALVDGVRAGRREAVARAVTLVESSRPDHREAARALLSALARAPVIAEVAQQPPVVEEVAQQPPVVEEVAQQPSRNPAPVSVRVGVSGVPGVGKSTFVETLGMRLVAAGHRVGVLAVDPSSVRTGGSVLGDKTRMPRLAAEPAAYVRPSPSAGTLGGVTRATSQAMTVLEAAAYDVVLVETVGVGQSEVAVAGMVDTYLFLTLARTGDQLQGIKKGTLEVADVIAVNKADGDRVDEARAAAGDLAAALRMVARSEGDGWATPVVACSALTDVGVDEVWARVLAHRAHLGPDGLAARRAAQQLDLTWTLVRDELDRRLRSSSAVARTLAEIRSAVLAGDLAAPVAADRILAAYDEA